ncbi:MAG: branched-chain amino acid ABC transporter permease [Halobacteriales archaeon]|nr:branched-chain amino acid ABC transporter permease [Halobacteriales archaeon]
MPLLDYLANGLVFSSIIVLASIGLSLVYSIADFANFAHGDTMAVGAYASLLTFGVVGSVGPTILALPVGFFIALAIGAAVAALVAVVTHVIVYEPLEVDSIGLLITSIGVAFVYRAIIRLRFGSSPIEFDIPIQRPIDALVPLGVRVTVHDVAIVASAALLVIGLHILLQYSDLGRKMRATADNPDLARVAGIRTRRVEWWTWIIGAGLAGVGGGFLGLYNQLSPRMGFNILLVVFAAVILGGIGSIYGAMAGGLLIGVINQLMPAISDVAIALPLVPNVGPAYADSVAFLIMVAVLLIRPSGIAGGERT